MVPEHSFLQNINSCKLAITPDGFYDNVEKGSIVLKRSQTFSLCKDGVVLGGDDAKPAITSDMVIFAAGFKGDEKLKQVFASPILQDYIMASPNTIVPLYRQCIFPRIPQLGVIGYSESVVNICTSELRCRWLFELLDEKFRLPSIEEMEKDILEWDKFMEYFGKYYRNSCIGAIRIWYNDQLCKDMGWNPMRKNGFWAELFEPYGPMDYTLP